MTNGVTSFLSYIHLCILKVFYCMYLLLGNEKKCSRNDSTNYCIIYPVFGEGSNTAEVQCLLPEDDTIVLYKIKH